MKPTISNAFNDGAPEHQGGGSAEAWGHRAQQVPPESGRARRNPRRSLAGSLSPMQADLRQASFGWSLELSPMQAIDALRALRLGAGDAQAVHYLVSMEQSTWRDQNDDRDLSISEIAQRAGVPVLQALNPDQLVMDENSLQHLVTLSQPSRLVAVAIEGEIDDRDRTAIDKAIDAERSPLLAELRALAALEVLGDRSVVLHCREKETALAMVAENFRHYLAAFSDNAAGQFVAPEPWQIERLLDHTGMLTVRPIETQRYSTAIDVAVNTTTERFSRPADQSLIYDIHSNTWHDDP